MKFRLLVREYGVLTQSTPMYVYQYVPVRGKDMKMYLVKFYRKP